MAALPEEVPAFKEARELYARRAELVADANGENTSEIKAVWARLGELRRHVCEDFPLSEPQCAHLLALLQEKVTALYKAEMAADKALEAAV
jgi:hypothetical protein